MEPTIRELLDSFQDDLSAAVFAPRLMARVEAVLLLHQSYEQAKQRRTLCTSCQTDWPCRTIRVLNATMTVKPFPLGHAYVSYASPVEGWKMGCYQYQPDKGFCGRQEAEHLSPGDER